MSTFVSAVFKPVRTLGRGWFKEIPSDLMSLSWNAAWAVVLCLLFRVTVLNLEFKSVWFWKVFFFFFPELFWEWATDLVPRHMQLFTSAVVFRQTEHSPVLLQYDRQKQRSHPAQCFTPVIAVLQRWRQENCLNLGQSGLLVSPRLGCYSETLLQNKPKQNAKSILVPCCHWLFCPIEGISLPLLPPNCSFLSLCSKRTAWWFWC